MYKAKVYEGAVYLVETDGINILTPFLDNLRNDYKVLSENKFNIKVTASTTFKSELPYVQEERLFNWIFKIINLQLGNTLGQISFSFKDANSVKSFPFCSEKRPGVKNYGISNIFLIDIEVNNEKLKSIKYKI
jgi:hypothetical protein